MDYTGKNKELIREMGDKTVTTDQKELWDKLHPDHPQGKETTDGRTNKTNT